MLEPGTRVSHAAVCLAATVGSLLVWVGEAGVRVYAASCLYSVTEAAVLAAGYAPAIGFIHTGKPLSFVYDIADIIKFDTVVLKAFEIARRNPTEPVREARLACRDIFRSVFPAPAGINLADAQQREQTVSVPRASGDKPFS